MKLKETIWFWAHEVVHFKLRHQMEENYLFWAGGWEGGVLRPVSINKVVKSEAVSFNVSAKNFTTASDVLSAVN